MFPKAFLAVGLCCALSTAAFADFSYAQNTKITGGAMAAMMKMAGAFSKAAREPITSTVMVKGDRMAHVSNNHISVIDLKTETITDIDPQRKTYSVITFADMAKAMQKMADKAAGKSKDDGTQMNVKASIKETGQTKNVAGFDTKEVVLTIEMEMQDKKSGNNGTMKVVSDMFLASKVAGYEEVREFYKRMSQKVAWAPGANPMMAARGDMMKGMGELAKESSKLEGVPVLQIMRMGGTGEGAIGGANAPAAQQAPPPPSASEAAGAAIASRLGGLGGFGGLGRKKKTEEQPKQQAETAPVAQTSDPSSLMEMTTELTSFSSATVDGSRFEIPAGFKQVESPMEKALR